MPRFGMTTLHPSFGRVYLASQNWVEVELTDGLDLSLDHCYELERIIRKETAEPYVLLGHCRSLREMQFEAKARISTFPWQRSGCDCHSCRSLRRLGGRRYCGRRYPAGQCARFPRRGRCARLAGSGLAARARSKRDSDRASERSGLAPTRHEKQRRDHDAQAQLGQWAQLDLGPRLLDQALIAEPADDESKAERAEEIAKRWLAATDQPSSKQHPCPRRRPQTKTPASLPGG